jgi:hypothetical protein
MVHFAVFGFLITNEVKIWHGGFTSKLVDELRLPKEHDMLLVLDSLLNLSGEMVSCLLLLDPVDLTEGTTTQLLDNFISSI